MDKIASEITFTKPDGKKVYLVPVEDKLIPLEEEGESN